MIDLVKHMILIRAYSDLIGLCIGMILILASVIVLVVKIFRRKHVRVRKKT